jgi:hypothetical protein
LTYRGTGGAQAGGTTQVLLGFSRDFRVEDRAATRLLTDEFVSGGSISYQ